MFRSKFSSTCAFRKLLISSLDLETLPPVPVSESTTIEADVTVGTGYSESKWVAERILAVAGQQTQLKPTTVRLHQLTGSANGVWKTSEWFPSIVATSSVLGCVPNSSDVRCLST